MHRCHKLKITESIFFYVYIVVCHFPLWLHSLQFPSTLEQMIYYYSMQSTVRKCVMFYTSDVQFVQTRFTYIIRLQACVTNLIRHRANSLSMLRHQSHRHARSHVENQRRLFWCYPHQPSLLYSHHDFYDQIPAKVHGVKTQLCTATTIPENGYLHHNV